MRKLQHHPLLVSNVFLHPALSYLYPPKQYYRGKITRQEYEEESSETLE